MKKRYIILISVVLMFIFGSVIPYTKPVLPFVQLPGEFYPGSHNWPIFGPLFGGLTNTFVATMLAWIGVILIGLSLKARSRTADEVPTGFYNFFEMIIEGAYNFAEGIAGPKIKNFFMFFMTFILLILVANWMELVPGVDSIGMFEDLAHKKAVETTETWEAAKVELGEHPSEEEIHHFEEEQYELYHALRLGDMKDEKVEVFGISFGFLTRAYEDDNGEKPEDAQYTIVPFLRAAATDLNFTLALALVAMVMVQYYGFKFLGFSYLYKFFPFLDKKFGASVSKNPIKVIDIPVGILELVSEFSKIISFAFRLLGNIFAGQILLFVMAYLISVANIVFFGLEFFVGLIQAAVFAMLALIFMTQASESHHADDEHH